MKALLVICVLALYSQLGWADQGSNYTCPATYQNLPFSSAEILSYYPDTTSGPLNCYYSDGKNKFAVFTPFPGETHPKPNSEHWRFYSWGPEPGGYGCNKNTGASSAADCAIKRD